VSEEKRTRVMEMERRDGNLRYELTRRMQPMMCKMGVIAAEIRI
jgi:hypothetical protein